MLTKLERDCYVNQRYICIPSDSEIKIIKINNAINILKSTFRFCFFYYHFFELFRVRTNYDLELIRSTISRTRDKNLKKKNYSKNLFLSIFKIESFIFDNK